MKIFLIIAQDDLGGPPSIEEAWDEWTWEENPDGFNRSVESTKKSHKDVRVASVEVSDDFLKRVFDAHEEKASEENVKDDPSAPESPPEPQEKEA